MIKKGLDQFGRYVVRNALHSRGDLTDIHDMIATELIKEQGFNPAKNKEFIAELHF